MSNIYTREDVKYKHNTESYLRMHHGTETIDKLQDAYDFCQSEDLAFATDDYGHFMVSSKRPGILEGRQTVIASINRHSGRIYTYHIEKGSRLYAYLTYLLEKLVKDNPKYFHQKEKADVAFD